MNNKKTTKRALLSSVMAIVLCLAMLIGTTFAWFTDSASTAVNKIQAGTLDVALEMQENGNWVSAEGKTLQFKTADNRTTNILWEPGCRYELPALRVVNKGNLALKYKIQITGIQGDAKLNEVIDWTINNAPINLTEGHLAAYAAGDSFTIKGVMKTTAGNEYQGLSIDGISITVLATQDTVENDSFDNQYDAGATYYPVIDFVGLQDALGKGGNITIADDFTGDKTKTELSDRLTIKTPTTLNFDGVYTVPGELEPTANWAGLYIAADTVINATEAGGIQCNNKDNGDCGTYVANVIDGANVTVNGGTYYGGGTTFQVQKGTLTINGGHFEVTPFGDPYNYDFLLNCVDANYQDGSAKIIVKGGTFVNFDPSNNKAEGTGTNFVADGYSVIRETKDNGDVWYTVVKGTVVVPSTKDDMNNGITGSSNKDVTVVMPANSSFTLDNGIANGGDKSRDITFSGNGSQTVDAITNAVSAEGGQLNYQRGSSFTFENLTIQAGEGSFDGIVCNELTFKDCTIKGKLTLYGKATFINCVFDNTMANQYSIWTWGGTDVTFENCTFNTNGKAILLYGQATASNPTNLVVNNCTFNDRNNGSAGKAAIEIGNDYNATYTLTVNNATVNGFAAGKNTGSTLWANKNSMDATHLTVTINGSKVQ